MSVYDVLIVGGGPAGLVAARYCLHAHLHAAIITPELGGKVNYPFALRDLHPVNVVWGAQLVSQFEQIVAEAQPMQQIPQHVSQITAAEDGAYQLRLTDGNTLRSRAVILATGAAPQRLYVEGEREYWGRGVSFSAVSHAPYFEGRDVAIIGGHRRTLIATLELAGLARRIFLIATHPQALAELPEAARVRAAPNVTFFTNWEVQAVVGDEYVTHINLVGINGETRQLAVDGVFVQMALIPNSELARDLVELDKEGHIIINHRCETSRPGIFAAGDVTNIQSEQVLVAIGEGAKAALSAWEYLAVHP
jgi:alkyl hydroperoxide reductase subunit AhpF